MQHDAQIDRKTAVVNWEAAFGTPPPAHLSVAFMQKALSYAAQCKAHGGLSAANRRTLKAFTKDSDLSIASGVSLRSGTQLVREWNGRTYQVQIVDGGFELGGKKRSSLSAVARHITGATWSGPRFFGLTNRRGGTL